MKNKMRIIFVIVLLIVLGIFLYYKRFEEQSIDVNQILAQSEFRNRTFGGHAVEVVAGDGALKAYLMEEHSLGIVSMAISFKNAGQAYELKEGVALMADNTMLDGAGPYTRKDLRELIKEKGIKIGVAAERDCFNVSLTYIKEFEDEAIKVLKAVLYEPLLDEKDLELTRQQLAVVKRQRAENPQYALRRLVQTEFYGSHPYGREDIAQDEVLNVVTSQDIRDYLSHIMGKDNLYIGVAGDIDKKQVADFLEDTFGRLPLKAQVQDLPEFYPDFKQAVVTTERLSSAQDFVFLLAAGVKRLDDDFYPLYLANYVFGGSGLNSRLNQAVREQNGLTYGISSFFSNSDAVDLWQVYYSATPDKADRALEIVRSEYQKFYQNGITVKELSEAKNALLSSFNLRFSTLSNVALMLREMQLQNLGIDFLERRQQMVKNISLDAVNRAIKKRMPAVIDENEGVRLFQVKGQKK